MRRRFSLDQRRNNLPILTRNFSFVICNEGYTIERYIHGWNKEYNDIQTWEYARIPKVFGGQGKYNEHRIKTKNELSRLFTDKEFCAASKLQVCI